MPVSAIWAGEIESCSTLTLFSVTSCHPTSLLSCTSIVSVRYTTVAFESSSTSTFQWRRKSYIGQLVTQHHGTMLNALWWRVKLHDEKIYHRTCIADAYRQCCHQPGVKRSVCQRVRSVYWELTIAGVQTCKVCSGDWVYCFNGRLLQLMRTPPRSLPHSSVTR